MRQFVGSHIPIFFVKKSLNPEFARNFFENLCFSVSPIEFPYGKSSGFEAATHLRTCAYVLCESLDHFSLSPVFMGIDLAEFLAIRADGDLMER
ncbi:hypothetical protein [Planctopirus hydrillae]|uniref:Uncharacterized protein n=1 Tax=Planctopirus hydrillae TaxID=1841610 RepID=A0A1C3EA26_9PLAN|nr:hypothetical protein [Planctopirus hydrillae]ODA30064.1 hypothetical protein A6X21_06940 [Planctopirus hydrillae]